nr:hypothetical protein [uncultured Chitinophaga sp.]
MNTTTPYEKLIAAKLDQVPVPDMADSIWASIALQLDAVADTPDDHSSEDTQTHNDQPVNNTPDSVAAKKSIVQYLSKGWYGFAGAAAAATALWWYSSQQPPMPEKTAPVKTLPETHVPAPPDSSAIAPPAEEKPTPVYKKKDSVSLIEALPPADTATRQVLPPPVDSPAVIHPPFISPAPDSVSAPPVKKPRGVKGITEDDYRISVQKDSSGKKY